MEEKEKDSQYKLKRPVAAAIGLMDCFPKEDDKKCESIIETPRVVISRHWFMSCLTDNRYQKYPGGAKCQTTRMEPEITLCRPYKAGHVSGQGIVSFTSRVNCQGNRIGPVCLYVCLSVSTLTTEPFDVRTRKDLGHLLSGRLVMPQLS